MKQLSSITVVLLMLACTACSRKEEPPQNIRLMAALRTAVSARNAQWLAETKTAFQKAVDKGQVSDDTAESFRAIFETAESGDWAKAEKQTIKLQKSRRPTATCTADHAHAH